MKGFVIISKDTGEVQCVGGNLKCFWEEESNAKAALTYHSQSGPKSRRVSKDEHVVVPAEIVPEF